MAESIILTSEKQDEEELLKVLEVLESIPGKYLKYELKRTSKKKNSEIQFIHSPSKSGPLVEQDFFDWMKAFRGPTGMDLGDSQILIVLTSRQIANNHFNGIDFPRNSIFVDLNNWEEIYLKDSPSKYPVAVHVLISIMLLIYFKEEKKAIEALHFEDKGCILDFNGAKKKVELKLLTARICPECLDRFMKNHSDTNLLAYFRCGLEKIRHDIVEGEYYKQIQPKLIKVKFQPAYNETCSYRIYFEGLGSPELDPIHTVVYLYFLVNKGGVYHPYVYRDYHFLDRLYQLVSKKDGIKPKTIQTICNLEKKDGELMKKDKQNDALSLKITKINKELTVLLGTFGLEKHYQIFKRGIAEKHGVNSEIVFEDETGILKQLKPLLGQLKL